jgi:hypothetical protein
MRYREAGKKGQTRASLANAFAFHQQFLATGDMHGVQIN